MQVTTSLAFSIVTILVGFWTALQMIVDIGPHRYYRHYYYESNTTKDDVNWLEYSEVIIDWDMFYTFFHFIS